jgi:hypothetical protein
VADHAGHRNAEGLPARPAAVRVASAAVLVLSLAFVCLAGCSGTPEAEASASLSATQTSDAARPAPPVLYLNVTLGNDTVALSSSAPATGNASQPLSGTAPVNATFELGASGLVGNATWVLSFGAGNVSAGNATDAAAVNGTTLPATVERAFAGNGTFNVTFGLQVGSAPVQRLDATIVIQSGNATAQARPLEVLLQTQFSGSLPADGAVQASHPFEVPDGATKVDVLYTSSHIGLFSALATVSDPGGERLSSSDACGFGSSGQATDTCLMTIEEDVGSGTWTIAITWQVGQATEDYTFDVTVSGYT